MNTMLYLSNPEEKDICRSLISWINDGSHSIPDDLFTNSYIDSVERYKTVFREIFVKINHEAQEGRRCAGSLVIFKIGIIRADSARNRSGAERGARSIGNH